MLKSICLDAFCQVYAQIYMSMCSLPCLCLDLQLYVLLAMFMLRSICLCALCHVCVQIYIFVHSVPCSHVQIYMFGCYVMCSYSLFCLLMYLFLVFWPFMQGVDLDLDLVVQVYIHTPKPISKGLDHFLYACPRLLACFYALSHVAYVDLGFNILFSLHRFVRVNLWAHLLVWLHPPLLWLIGSLVRYTFMVLVWLRHTFPCSVRC